MANRELATYRRAKQVRDVSERKRLETIGIRPLMREAKLSRTGFQRDQRYAGSASNSFENQTSSSQILNLSNIPVTPDYTGV